MTVNNKQKQLFIIVLVIVAVIGIACFVGTQKNKLSSTPPTNTTVSPTATANPATDWETYTNSEFSFSVVYPARFTSSPVPTGDDFYKTVAKLSSKYNEIIKISVINNVDIYQNQEVTKVATREVMDSGYKYTVSPTKINQYSAAITSMDVVTTEENLVTQTVTITIQHPKKNLYVVLVLPKSISKAEFEQILSSFKFTN